MLHQVRYPPRAQMYTRPLKKCTIATHGSITHAPRFFVVSNLALVFWRLKRPGIRVGSRAASDEDGPGPGAVRGGRESLCGGVGARLPPLVPRASIPQGKTSSGAHRWTTATSILGTNRSRLEEIRRLCRTGRKQQSACIHSCASDQNR